MLIIAVLCGVFLVLYNDPEWLSGRIFYIMTAILFFHPMIKSVWGEKRPEGWWIAFAVGSLLLAIYALVIVRSIEGIVEIFLLITFFTVLSSFGTMIANRLRGVNNKRY